MSRLEEKLREASRGLEDKERQLAATMKDLEQRVRINKELTRIALMSDAEEKADDVVDYFRKIAMGKEKMKPTAWKALDNAVESCSGTSGQTTARAAAADHPALEGRTEAGTDSKNHGGKDADGMEQSETGRRNMWRPPSRMSQFFH